MAVLGNANQLIQVMADAGITDTVLATRLFRIVLQQALLLRQNQLATKQMSGNSLTATEITEMASNEAALANLAQQLS